MPKVIMDFTVVEARPLHSLYSLLTLRPQQAQDSLPPVAPGQFVQVRVDDSSTFLRRPISICDADCSERILRLLVRDAGPGTRWMTERRPGDNLNLLLPLGNGFAVAGGNASRPLLVGGGVGVAPMLLLARAYHESGAEPTAIIGARSRQDLLLADEIGAVARVFLTTEDGSAGDRGFVTDSAAWSGDYTQVDCCGPAPMMRAVAKVCRDKGLPCRVSLENMMACGLGACLCCVEKTVRGNVCVCTEGPVFSTDDLTW